MCDLNSDVLYLIASHLIPAFPRSTPLAIVQETRRHILYPLLFVCRLFRDTYEPLLYHSIVVRYDEYYSSCRNEVHAWYSVQDWVTRTGAHADRALWETLNARPEIRSWVRRMELEWDLAIERNRKQKSKVQR